MYVTTTPSTWTTGEPLDPRDLNEVAQYASDVLEDTAAKRYREVVLPLFFAHDAGAGYKHSDPVEVRSFRFIAPVRCIITRGYLSCFGESPDALEVILFKASTGTAPEGATVPWLSTEGPVSPDEEATDFNPSRIVLEADTEYVFRLQGTGDWATENLDVYVHLLVDRWNTDGLEDVPDFKPVLLDESHGADADVVAGNVSAMGAEAAKFASRKSAPVPALFCLHNVGSSTGSAQTRFAFPLFSSSRSASRLTHVYAWAVMNGTTGEWVDVAVVGQLLRMPTAGVTLASDVLTPSMDMTAPFEDVSSDPSYDASLIFAVSGPATARKIYALVWFDV